MTLSFHNQMDWFTTPQELRSIADEMEKKWEKIKDGPAGQSTQVNQLFHRGNSLSICIDQIRMVENQGWKPEDETNLSGQKDSFIPGGLPETPPDLA